MRHSRATGLGLCGVIGLAAAAQLANGVTLGGADADYRSFANVDEFRLTRLDLILEVDFTNRELDGVAVLELKRADPRSTELVLDTKGLRIRTVSELSGNFLGATERTKAIWVTRPFHLGKANSELGSPLYIDLAPSKEGTETVKIEYETTDQASALKWRVPEKKDGKPRPFMYTSPGPIQARSWIPLQDTPKVRVTYKALVKTGDGFLAVMGGGNDPKVKRNGSYSFMMPKAVPTYLLSLAIGDLDFKETGPRSGVFAESSLAKPAAKQFADTEAMLAAAEQLLGHYPFARFDQLVMPLAFPIGQAGYPTVAYVSPSLIAGDQAPQSALANAVAQSWSGQLVTNATWRDRWLNQAFATYLQRRIMSAVGGEPREAIQEILDVEAFRAAMATCDSDDQLLATDLTDVESDEVCAGVAAEKGSLMLTWLDAKFGRDKFDAFLRGYFARFAAQSVSSEQFEGYLEENLLDRYPGVATRAELTAWISNPGLPDDAVLPAADAAASIDGVRASFLTGKVPAAKIDVHDWVDPQWIYFLNGMPSAPKLEQLSELDRAYSLTAARSAEVAQAWLLLAIRCDYRPAFTRLEAYLKSVGRTRLIVPLYRELVKSSAGFEFAQRVYALARPGYDARTAQRIDALVKFDSTATE